MAEVKYRICDIKDCDNKVPEKFQDILVSVKFTTEQTEGRPITPYLATHKLDLCESCIQKMLRNNIIITGSGAQGYNEYIL